MGSRGFGQGTSGDVTRFSRNSPFFKVFSSIERSPFTSLSLLVVPAIGLVALILSDRGVTKSPLFNKSALPKLHFLSRESFFLVSSRLFAEVTSKREQLAAYLPCPLFVETGQKECLEMLIVFFQTC